MAQPPHPKTLLRLAEETDRLRLIELALSPAESPEVYNGPEIEITPAMLAAGATALEASYEFSVAEDCVRAVYIAMTLSKDTQPHS
jgi:hypothetical protein